MREFVRVGTLREFRDGRGRVVSVGDGRVAVFRTGRRFVAVADRCPHMGASLAEGELAGGRVVCAWHGWKFDAETGRSEGRTGRSVAVYEVRLEGQDVYLRRAPRQAPPERDPSKGRGGPPARPGA